VAPFAGLEARLGRMGGDGMVLDLGCGTGVWLSRLAASGSSIVGVEADRARARLASGHGPVAVGDGARLPVRSNSVDAVWCLHVLHHVADPGSVLGEARRVLRPGGTLLIAESVEDNPLIRVARTLWPSWEGVPVRSRFTAAQLAATVTAAGFAVVERRQHSPASFAALVLPAGGAPLWALLTWLERRLPAAAHRRGAYVDCVAVAS
jgi:SAM-dependent methyltransferase